MNQSYRSKIAGVISGIVALILVITLWTGYNGLVRKDNDVDLKFSLVKSKLQLRHDAITSMIGAINGLQEFATEVWTAITESRAYYNDNKNSNDPDVINEADVGVTDALYDLLVVVEDNRPVGVSVDAAYIGFLDSVLSMEYQLDVARQNYNTSVTSFNVSIELFPAILYAKLFGFGTQRELWAVSEYADDLPTFGD